MLLQEVVVLCGHWYWFDEYRGIAHKCFGLQVFLPFFEYDCRRLFLLAFFDSSWARAFQCSGAGGHRWDMAPTTKELAIRGACNFLRPNFAMHASGCNSVR